MAPYPAVIIARPRPACQGVETPAGRVSSPGRRSGQSRKRVLWRQPMAGLEDVRRIARSLPDTDGDDGFAVRNGSKLRGFAWVWMKRVEPNKPRVPCPEVIAIRTAALDEKEGVIAA